MHSPALLGTLAAALGLAFLFGVILRRAGVSPLPGYLLAGVVLGPYTPGLSADPALAAELAELGVLLLLFTTGLQFHGEDLLRTRKVAVPGPLVKALVVVAAGTAAFKAAGLTTGEAALLSVCAALASTVVALRALDDVGRLSTPAGATVVGWLVVEDVLAVVALVALPAIAGPTRGLALVSTLAVAVVKIAAFAALVLAAGRFLLGRLLAVVAALRSRELFTLAVVAWMLAVAFLGARLFGASMPLGAFLAGLALAGSGYGARAASDALPLRDAFAALFFVGTGMLLDGRALFAAPAVVAVSLGLVLLVAPAAAFVGARLFGGPGETPRTVAGALAQVGEFGFLLAAEGVRLGLLPKVATPALVATALVAIGAQPIVFRTLLLLGRATARDEGGDPLACPPDERHRVVLVGYGPVGAQMARLLDGAGLAPVILERSPEAVRAAREAGYPAILGDAGRRAVLEDAGIGAARALVLSSSEAGNAVAALARELAPELLVVGRVTFLRERGALEAAGAQHAVVAEAEVAGAMADRVLEALGASEEERLKARETVGAALRSGPLVAS